MADKVNKELNLEELKKVTGGNVIETPSNLSENKKPDRVAKGPRGPKIDK